MIDETALIAMQQQLAQQAAFAQIPNEVKRVSSHHSVPAVEILKYCRKVHLAFPSSHLEQQRSRNQCIIRGGMEQTH